MQIPNESCSKRKVIGNMFATRTLRMFLLQLFTELVGDF